MQVYIKYKKGKGMEIDYSIYRLTTFEWIYCLCKYTLLLIGIGILFYDSILSTILISPIIYLFIKQEINKKKAIRLKQLNLEYKELILSVASSLNAGYSLENSFRNSQKDIKVIFPKGSYIEQELNIIINGIENNIPIEKMMLKFADRSGLEEAHNFAEILKIAKRSGGNLIKIIGKTAQKISEKIEVNQEIDTTIASKKLEQRIMELMPFLIVLYIRISNFDYVKGLYHNPIGIIVMTISLGLTFITNMWARKIVNIEV